MFREILEMPSVAKNHGLPKCAWTVVHRHERTSTGSQANRMDDQFIKDGQSGRSQVLRRAQISGGPHKTRVAERHPIRLVIAVLRAFRQEVRERSQLSVIEAGQHVDEPDVWLINPE